MHHPHSDCKRRWQAKIEPAGPRTLHRPVASLIVTCLALAAVPSQADPPQKSLREQLTGLIRGGQYEAAISTAQQALSAAPADRAVISEYVDLHLSLARLWLRQKDYALAEAALDAVLAVQPDNAEAKESSAWLARTREVARRAAAPIENLLAFELFDAALERIREVEALQPALATDLRSDERTAWLGAADDHYLAGNANEALALYEKLLIGEGDCAQPIQTRWLICLGLALDEAGTKPGLDAGDIARLSARAQAVIPQAGDAVVGRIVTGLLAEAADKPIEAARNYADALGQAWELPSAEQRREALAQLRKQAAARLRAARASTPTQRRTGAWSPVLEDVWKERSTPHFHVLARNDVVAARVADALEFHCDGLARWLGSEPAADWKPLCEVRVHASIQALHKETGASGMATAASRIRTQAGRVLLRTIDVVQTDPWLLSSTLPRELTRVMLADLSADGTLPLLIEEGIVCQAEPPARRLMYRRTLATARREALGELLAVTDLPADSEPFSALADAAAAFLMPRFVQPAPASAASRGAGVKRLIAGLQQQSADRWWAGAGFADSAAGEAAWSAWCRLRGNPPRMPLMLTGGDTR